MSALIEVVRKVEVNCECPSCQGLLQDGSAAFDDTFDDTGFLYTVSYRCMECEKTTTIKYAPMSIVTEGKEEST